MNNIVLALLLASAASVSDARPAANPEYTALSFSSAPGKCAGLGSTGTVQLVDCCDKSVLKVACLRTRLGPMSSYCTLVTPASGPAPCRYLKANKAAATEPIRLGAMQRGDGTADTNPADKWNYFTRFGGDLFDDTNPNFQWTISDSDRTVTNLCLDADAATGAVRLAKCAANKPSQKVTTSVYTGPGVNGQCFAPPAGGTAVLINSCNKQ